MFKAIRTLKLLRLLKKDRFPRFEISEHPEQVVKSLLLPTMTWSVTEDGLKVLFVHLNPYTFLAYRGHAQSHTGLNKTETCLDISSLNDSMTCSSLDVSNRFQDTLHHRERGQRQRVMKTVPMKAPSNFLRLVICLLKQTFLEA